MTEQRDPTDELISYLEMRLEADGLDYREAVMIEDLMASLTKVRDVADAQNGLADRDTGVRHPLAPSGGL